MGVQQDTVFLRRMFVFCKRQDLVEHLAGILGGVSTPFCSEYKDKIIVAKRAGKKDLL